LAERVRAGSVVVNDTLINGGMCDAPFGGIKQSGFGRAMGEEGLRSMCHTRHLSLERVKMPKRNPFGFPYTEKNYRRFGRALRAMFSSGGIFHRMSRFF
jgi:succinate-semialdehyde dehydrogenase/glutarate-semialdehyde dehydrogenase